MYRIVYGHHTTRDGQYVISEYTLLGKHDGGKRVGRRVDGEVDDDRRGSRAAVVGDEGKSVEAGDVVARRVSQIRRCAGERAARWRRGEGGIQRVAVGISADERKVRR